VEIDFIARGENEKIIRESGLTVESDEGIFIAFPKIVTSQPSMVERCDVLICCTKSYDLEQTLIQLTPLISRKTIILPLLNGVDSYERIRKILPHARIWEGCVYIVSRLIAPGYVKQTGSTVSLHFGENGGSKQESIQLLKIFIDAGINAHLSHNIKRTIWEKFLFISPLATITTYLRSPIGVILANKDSENLLKLLLSELHQVALAYGINLLDNIITSTFEKMVALPYNATSSMHDDLQKNNNIEVESLTGYVVRLGQKLNVPTPVYQKLYESLTKIVRSS
jgi:2-dehydropantoate 2-reductase